MKTSVKQFAIADMNVPVGLLVDVDAVYVLWCVDGAQQSLRVGYVVMHPQSKANWVLGLFRTGRAAAVTPTAKSVTVLR